MDAASKPIETYPTRVPIKVIGNPELLRAEQVVMLFMEKLEGRTGEPPLDWPELFQFSAHAKGAWISLTFWITLPDEHTEKPLREAIQKLPGVVMQL